jgi:uncharacterized protein YukE
VVAALDSAAATCTAAARALERSLEGTRPQWDDSARHTFDSQYANPLLTHATRSAAELTQLAQELNAAVRLLESTA